ncbi:alpha/beta hydrolase [Psychrobacillus sp. PGGUH221]|uniref:alpha/beta fold hydrolase n=1 Tax=Psychrobacillus sp. PGGUH221 TaxID=3020058 RepID=UPI0035C76DCC
MVIHYVEYGDKNAPLIVFLHGGGVSGWMWDEQVRYFKQYHCLVPDLPAQGISSENSFSIKGSAEKLNELIEEKAQDKEIIVTGFSLGAQVLIEMLSLKPNLIDYAIINSALVRPSTVAKSLIGPSIRLTFPLIKNKAFSKFQSRTLYIREDQFEKYYTESTQMKKETLIQILEENMSYKIPHNFNKAKSKILVTVGEKEKSIMKKSAVDLLKSNPHCNGLIIPNVGHGIPIADPDYFNNLLENWITYERTPIDSIKIT